MKNFKTNYKVQFFSNLRWVYIADRRAIYIYIQDTVLFHESEHNLFFILSGMKVVSETNSWLTFLCQVVFGGCCRQIRKYLSPTTLIIIIIIITILIGAFISIFPNQLKAPQGWNFEACCQWTLFNVQIITQQLTFTVQKYIYCSVIIWTWILKLQVNGLLPKRVHSSQTCPSSNHTAESTTCNCLTRLLHGTQCV